jgi:hypothetical protein
MKYQYICSNCDSLEVIATNKKELKAAIKNDDLVSWHTIEKEEFDNAAKFVFICQNCFEYDGDETKSMPIKEIVIKIEGKI